MAATPQFATFTFVGLGSKKTYSVDAYISDVNAALVRFDGGSGASSTSPTDWTPLEDVVLTDVAIVTGTADTERLQLQRGNAPTGDFVRYVPHLTTNAMRPRLSIGVRAGIPFRATQVSD